MATLIRRTFIAEPTVLVVEGTMAKVAWRQYLVVTEGRVAIVEMVPALLTGWRFNRVTVQGAADWPGYSQRAIVDFVMASHGQSGPTPAPDLGEFKRKLLAVAAAGRLPDDGE